LSLTQHGAAVAGRNSSSPFIAHEAPWRMLNSANLRPSVSFDCRLQTAKGIVPLLGDQVEMAARLSQAPPFQYPNAFAPAPRAMDETRVFHHVQVFRNCLTGDSRSRRESADGHRSAITEPGD
jgi:hypothetical protein